jgi:hypothetical protein
VHIDQQHGEAFVFFGGGVGAHHQFAPVGGPAVAGPDLLTGYHEAIAIEGGFGAEGGEVGAGVGLGEALAPDLRATEDFGEIALLLGFAAEGDQGGTDQFEAQDAGQGRRSDAGHLFGEDGLLHEGGPAPAVLLGPGEAGPAALVDLALPVAEEGEAGFHTGFSAIGGGLARFPIAGRVGFEPGAEFVAELPLLRGRVEVHS